MEPAPRPAATPAHPGAVPSRTERGPSLGTDPDDLALAARSILSCPAEVELQVDGVATALGEDAALGLADPHGSPRFSCHPAAVLSDAAELGRSALMTVSSGLGLDGSPDRGTDLILAGRLVVLGVDYCPCCAETRSIVGLEVTMVALTRRGPHGEEHQLRVPVEAYRSSAHHLNRGFLQRAVEHANDGHQDELRHAVSMSSGTRLADVVGVRLTGLTSRGVEVVWVDPIGAHLTIVDFPSPARTPAELGEMLRRCLHAGLC